ncbi:MAG: glycosyltransferase family 2 protein [Candidatus Competibacteraceae bacterium]
MPKISLITACHNSAATLPETLASVRTQRDADLEYRVVDGGSKDGTLYILQQNDWISHWISEPDDGIYDALNKGLELATGDIIGLLHADDVLADDRVLSRVAKVFADPEVGVCYGDLVYISRDHPERVVRYWRAGEYRPDLLRRGWMPPHPTLYVRRRLYQQHGGFDTRYRIAADYDCMLRLLSRMEGRVVYIPEVLVRMRTGGVSNRSLGNILRKSAEDYQALRANRIGGFGALAWKNLSKLGQFWRPLIT